MVATLLRIIAVSNRVKERIGKAKKRISTLTPLSTGARMPVPELLLCITLSMTGAFVKSND